MDVRNWRRVASVRAQWRYIYVVQETKTHPQVVKPGEDLLDYYKSLSTFQNSNKAL